MHECGHALAAIMAGCGAIIHYGWTNYYRCRNNSEAWDLIKGLAGPFVNILIGSVGFVLLSRNCRRGIRNQEVLLAAISFFWSREIVVWVADLFIKPYWYKNAFVSDEERASLQLFDKPFVFSILFGVIGMLACGITVFRLLEKEKRLSFIIFGMLGSIAGYLFWFHFLGPVLLP
ncbi:hypothetical protein DN068_09785 [Taibaiella soli]|uniref:M50 family peptidase n=1 Tax=Taibaiella soli TaxID=1649169 RepID=A0A2W2AHX4_9BACT|nr:hypothetical protein DN068_09785 [Taibaiella soli]